MVKKAGSDFRYSDGDKIRLKREFLLVYRDQGLSWKASAEEVGTAPRTLLTWKHNDSEFSEAWDAIERSRHYDPVKCKEMFLEGMREVFNPFAAAAYAGPSLPTFKVWRKQDPEFAKAWRDVVTECLWNIKGAQYKRALSGDRGSEVSAAILLNAYEPTRFKQGGGAGVGGGNMTFNFIVGRAPEQIPEPTPKKLAAHTDEEIDVIIDKFIDADT